MKGAYAVYSAIQSKIDDVKYNKEQCRMLIRHVSYNKSFLERMIRTCEVEGGTLDKEGKRCHSA